MADRTGGFPRPRAAHFTHCGLHLFLCFVPALSLPVRSAIPPESLPANESQQRQQGQQLKDSAVAPFAPLLAAHYSSLSSASSAVKLMRLSCAGICVRLLTMQVARSFDAHSVAAPALLTPVFACCRHSPLPSFLFPSLSLVSSRHVKETVEEVCSGCARSSHVWNGRGRR